MGVSFSTPIVVEPNKFTWFDVELPDPDRFEVIVRNKACLVCGSDLHLYKGLHPFAPLPACCGHEVAADVIEVGSEVSTIDAGDRVYVTGTGASPIPCGQCFHCGRGNPDKCLNPHLSTSFEVGGKEVSRFPSGFGEYTITHESMIYPIPENVSYYEAAVTTDMAYVIGVVKRSMASVGNSTVIIGAGPIGLRTLDILKVSGVSPIIVSETLDYRRECALELGADHVIDPIAEDAVRRVIKLTDGKGVDKVFDAAGNTKATNQGLRMLKTKKGGAGTLYLMGLYEKPEITIDLSDLMHRAGRIVSEWGLMSTWGEDVEAALDLMRRGKLNVEKWITHKIPEDRADEAMEMLIEKRGKAIGVEIIH